MNHLYYMFIFFTLSGLLKITSLLTFIPLLFLFFLELTGLSKLLNMPSKFIKNHTQTIFLIAGHIIAICSWYFYAISYNTYHQTNYFSTKTHPLWSLDSIQIQDVINNVNWTWRHEYFSSVTIYLLLVLLIVLILRWKRQNMFYVYMNTSIAFGTILYVILWFDAFKSHDYYFIDIIVFFIFLIFTFLHYLTKNHAELSKSYIVKSICCIFLLFNIKYAHTKINERYLYNSWQNNLGNKSILSKIKPDLIEIGINKDDKVISIPDPSPNHTLYLMNQPGWTDLYGNASSSQNIHALIQVGAKYLIVNDTTILQKRSYLKEFTSDEVYDNHGVKIFKL